MAPSKDLFRRIAWIAGQILFLGLLAGAIMLILTSGFASGFFRLVLVICCGLLAAADVVILLLKE